MNQHADACDSSRRLATPQSSSAITTSWQRPWLYNILARNRGIYWPRLTIRRPCCLCQGTRRLGMPISIVRCPTLTAPPPRYFGHFQTNLVSSQSRLTSVFAEYYPSRPSQAYSNLPEYNVRRPSQDPMYLQDAVPGAADPQLQQHFTAYDRQNDHMSYGASSLYQPRASFEATPSAYNDFEPRETLEVLFCNPRQGTERALVQIHLKSSRDLLSPSPWIASLMFATRSVPAGLNLLEAPGQDLYYKYLVSATAPAFSETESSISKIPLHLQLREQSGLDERQIEAGEWIYEDGVKLEHRSSSQEVSRKRKIADEAPDTPRSTKRVTPLEQQSTQSEGYGLYSYPSASLAYPQSLHNIDLSTMQRKYTAYGRSQLQQSLQPESNKIGSQGLIGGASTSQSLMRPLTGQTSSWNSSYVAGYQSGSNTQPTAAPSFQVSSISSPTPANPILVRSTILAKQPSPGKTSAGSSPDRNFNPYTLYPNGAVLEIRGKLNAMQENWTAEERAVKRRIVRFWREQNGTTLKAYFKPVRADEPPLPHETSERRISCIYWEERNKYYVTSVDTIQLLQSLVTAKFGHEEKNRIRRNLETYQPCTVKKSDPDSEDFFKLVMGFSTPRPRSIEKDVKVFEWATLEQALKKVISKYVFSPSLIEDTRYTDRHQSADPTSTAAPFRRQPFSNFSGAQSEAGASRYSALSSRSTSGSTASGAYSQTYASNTLSPPIASDSLPNYLQEPPLQHFSAPSPSHSYTVPTLGSRYIPGDPANSPYTAQVSIPSLSPAYTTSTIGRRRSSDALTDDTLTSTSHYSRRPHTSTSFPSPYAQQGLGDATAPLGLAGRASIDLSAGAAYFNADATSSGSLDDAQYWRNPGVNDETDTTQFKEE